MDMTVEHAKLVTQACTVLHNICEVQKVPYVGEKINIKKLRAMKKNYLPLNLAENTGTQPSALATKKRDYVADQLLNDPYTFKRKY